MDNKKDNPVPSIDKIISRIKIGIEGACDCTLLLDEKEYLIESTGWELLGYIMQKDFNGLLNYIKENFTDDLQNGVETDNEQPKCTCCGSSIPTNHCSHCEAGQL